MREQVYLRQLRSTWTFVKGLKNLTRDGVPALLLLPLLRDCEAQLRVLTLAFVVIGPEMVAEDLCDTCVALGGMHEICDMLAKHLDPTRDMMTHSQVFEA